MTVAIETLPFAETPRTPSDAKIPWWLTALTTTAATAGAVYGWLTASGVVRWPRALFFASGLSYLTTSVVDFVEHFRLEKRTTGRWWSASAVPLGESINHALTISTLLSVFALARPLPSTLAARDWYVLAAPALFLVLGWRDEIVYHRRRALHREDIMHTVSHLAAGVMLTSFYVMRLAMRS